MLIIFSGGSGVGKNTVIEHLIAHGGFALMPTYTTRARRPNESEGHPYHFLSDAEFEAKLREGEFYEHQQVHGHYYGTSKKLLRESLATGKILLKDIDVLGTQNLVRAVGGDLKIVTIFLKVDSSDVLAERLRGRGEQEIELRLRRFDMEQSHAAEYDYIINNVDLQATLSAVLQIVQEETSGAPMYATREQKAELASLLPVAEKLRAGEKLPPVPVVQSGGKSYLLDGQDAYLAARMAGARLAKELVVRPLPPLPDEAAWLSLVKQADELVK